MKNILIAVSGTGGHVYPGIALAYELKQKGYNPVFVVNNNKNGVSLKIVSTSGYDYEILDFKAPPRKISPGLFLFPFKFIKTLSKAKKILNKVSPIAVVGMGAYLSFPVLLMAKMKKIPTLIHEQNSIPGLANRLLSKIVTKVAISFTNSEKFFNKKKTIFTSNPIRKDIFNISRAEAAKKLNIDANIFTIFVFGGSLGATKLNNIMFNVNEYLFNRHKGKIQFIHITGNNDFETLDNKYKKLNTKKFITKYMNDIGNAYACSDLLVCRAGAGTVKEVENYNLPALFIPFPYATDNHQYFNAKSVEVPNFRIVIEEKNITEQEIIKFIEQYISNVIDVTRIVSPEYFPQEILAEEVLKLTNEKI
jgi:UDP-N-acetylglucosamine--N-acetylmuramyl-(pentapeptide) pyrophosphoryl-undecaprenol N-acetylglucosamine transferase